VNEWLFFEGDVSGALSAFRHDTATGALTAVSPRRSSHGDAPRHAHIDRRGRCAPAANYVGGNIAVLPIAADGSLGNPTSRFAFGGHGPNATRQESPHAHCIMLDADNRLAYVAHLGTDRIHVFAVDTENTPVSVCLLFA